MIENLLRKIAESQTIQPVSDEDLDKLIKAAELSPSPFFTMHWQQVVQIASQAKRANQGPQDGPSLNDKIVARYREISPTTVEFLTELVKKDEAENGN